MVRWERVSLVWRSASLHLCLRLPCGSRGHFLIRMGKYWKQTEKKNTSTLLGGTCFSETNYAIERGVEGEAILKPSIQAALMSMDSPVGAGRLSNLKRDPGFM